ncbi:MAG: transferrin receptor-like dimerization domain-containing protein [Woeseiaceae bacterium]|nr:transferrin receptor-like dimerization domain-containing protein [Woeseiaceae bacterium]
MVAVLAAGFSLSAQADNLLGYGTDASEAQRALESRFDAGLNAEEMDAWLRRLSSKPHHVGSAAGREVVDFTAELFESWGYDVEIAEYEILLPTPVTRELELVAPTQYTATLTEDSLPEDPSTSERGDLLPPYNAFSPDGEVEGELVFVNYGIPEDYDILERHGIDVEGKIAIAKYGRSWRGIKPKLAGEKGAIATIIYSDPADDGYGVGDTYPKGPYKHESGVQRGSVMDMPTYPGDVLTPGTGATPRARRLDIEDAPTIAKIPVLPISHRDALPLLAAMDGAVVPPEWRGDLPITYHLGPGPARVRMKLEFDWRRVPAYNVIARLEGSEFPDEWVLRGNHHDGWNHGAADPISGLVALLAEAQSVAALARAGNAPKRTIIYAAWDAEEPGLIGSTEWAEHHARDLDDHAVAYLNTDGNSRGFVSIGGSHTLERFFNQIIEDVHDPRLDMSLKERRRAMLKINASGEKERAEAERDDLRIYPMGSGSDYTPFLQHLGIASANMSFGGEGEGGSYHTLYDTYEHYTTWRDPGLDYGVALAEVAGRATLRLANAPRLPFEFQGLADNVALYVGELEALAEEMREQTETVNRRLDEGLYAAALNPYRSLGPPKRETPVPYFNFAPLKNALDRLQSAADAYADIAAEGGPATAEVNELLYTTERLLTRSAGLPGRSWYKHHIYAPGFYTGYGVKTLPAVREAIEQRDYAMVAEQIPVTAAVLDRLSERIETIVNKETD